MNLSDELCVLLGDFARHGFFLYDTTKRRANTKLVLRLGSGFLFFTCVWGSGLLIPTRLDALEQRTFYGGTC